MYGLGIDIGTTYTAAAVWRDGRAEIFPLGDKTAAIPSIVLVREDETVLTGETAQRRALSEPQRVAREFKRRIGDSVPILLGGTPYSPEALVAKLIAAVVEQVSARQGEPPAHVCLSHPANWGPFKRDRMHQAVRIAGLSQPFRFTTEPEAAAVFYAHEQRVDPGSVVAVYDLGGGTFDATVLRKRTSGFEILGRPEGVEQLGGIDIDAAVFDHVSRTLGDTLDDLDEDDPADLTAVARLKQECVEAKEALSADTDATIPVLLPNTSTEVRLTREELETTVRPMLHGTIEALRRALESAHVAANDLHSVLLVGGASRMPLVSQLVGSELGRPVAVDAHPKHAVAIGASWLAAGALAPPRQWQAPAAPPPARHPQPPVTPAATTQRVTVPADDGSGRPQRTEPLTVPQPAPVDADPGTTSTTSVTRGRRRLLVPALVGVALLLVAALGTWWWGDQAGWFNGADSRADTGETTSDSGFTEEPPTAAEELAAILDGDEADVRGLLGSWVPQLSAKSEGLVVDGTTYDADAILANHHDLRERYPEARLLWSGDYPIFRFDNYFVTVFAVPFASPDEANQWCDAEGFPADDCFAKRLSDTGSWEDAAVYR
ncbi:Hsp70 family protein [Haloechinothrix salitolerans]|uniref:Hsp70 family protein n=1 Tax=Haloechinothrix salitolerans TaxID=926830 RepID=A0ABW2BZ68_9PSEU